MRVMLFFGLHVWTVIRSHDRRPRRTGLVMIASISCKANANRMRLFLLGGGMVAPPVEQGLGSDMSSLTHTLCLETLGRN